MPFISYTVEKSKLEPREKINFEINKYYPARIIDAKFQWEKLMVYFDIEGRRVSFGFKLWDSKVTTLAWHHKKFQELCNAIHFNIPYSEDTKKAEFDSDEVIGKELSVSFECFGGSDTPVLTRFAAFGTSENGHEDKKPSLLRSEKPSIPQSAYLDDEIPF